MTTRSNGPLAGFDWLKRGINVGYANPKAVFGGSAFLLLMALVPALITLSIQFGAMRLGTQPDSATIGWVMAISALGGLLLIPLYGGYLQVIDAAERGLPARARDVFQPYRQGGALRLIGYGLAMLVVYVAAFGIIIAVSGTGIARWYAQLMAAQLHHQQLPAVAMPDGIGMAVALMMVFGLFMMGAYAISLGQVALRRRNVFAAIGDGFAGALKNVLPLLVFVISLLVALIVFVVVVILLAGLLTLLGKLAGTWLVMLLVAPLYIGVMVAMYAAMFGTMYYLWRDVCGDDDHVPAVAQSIAA